MRSLFTGEKCDASPAPSTPRSSELALHAIHDVHKFIVEAFKEWFINTDGEVDVLVE